jgi:hypothetical protein
MDRDRFDALARLLATSGSRRVTLGALLGALLGPAAGESVARKRGNGRGKDRDSGQNNERGAGKDQGREREQRVQAERRKGGKRRKHKKKRRGGSDGGGQPEPPPADCCGTESCPNPEPGSTSADCDFAGRSFVGDDHNGSIFRGIDGRGANFGQTNNRGSVFAEACLQGAAFHDAELGGSTWGDACLFDADFRGADLGGDETLFDNAMFCGTRMPDGSVNDRDCGRATRCCQRDAEPGPSPGPGPACQSAGDCPAEACHTKACQGGQCVYVVVADGPDPDGACAGGALRHCCAGECCAANATACNPQGLCCVPNCAGRTCGPDGCGNADGCGTCPAGQPCSDEGRCGCNAQTCPDGCCDLNGLCVPGNTLQNCGTGGEACEPCSNAEICQNGQCVTCSPNCTCMGQNFCAEPADNTTCFVADAGEGPECVCLVSRAGQPFCSGTQDASGFACTTDVDCQGFAPGSVCVDAAPSGSLCQSGNNFCAAPCCTPQNCPGCCSGGTCLPGTTREACGIDGGLCVDCSEGGDVCQNGQCVCTGESCPSGCCDAGPGNSGVCLPGNSADSCGTNGALCATCGSGQVCHNQQCCTPNCTGMECGSDGCGGSCGACASGQECSPNGFCVCTEQSCTGCCELDETCQPGTSTGACGMGGQLCMVCGSGQSCQNQQCTS